MKWSGLRGFSFELAVCSAAFAGCAAVAPHGVADPTTVAVPLAVSSQGTGRGAVRQASLDETLGADGFVPQRGNDQLSPPAAELVLDELVNQVLARNPSLAEMTAAWQAASARYGQVTALDDPMIGATLGPASFGSKDVDGAYRLEVAQKLPFPGKLGLRGQSALAEAAAAGHDVADMRLRLVEAAQQAFYDYYLVERAIVVNDENVRLLERFKENALSRFKTGLAPFQDALQANVELGRARQKALTLERTRRVAVARLNTLMHFPADGPLPPPPATLAIAEGLPDPRELSSRAVSQRPDLRALLDRIAADEASLRLADREFFPDFEVMAAYDAFWQPPEKDLRPMLALRANVPVQLGRRHAAVAEAQARLARRRAELDRQTDQVSFEVQQAYEQVRESQQVIRLYQKSILPAAELNVQAAEPAYTTGKVPFLSLVESQRGLIELRDRYYEAQADFFRRRATLERAIGGPLVPISEGSP